MNKRTFRAFLVRLSASLSRTDTPQADQDLESELESHIQMHTDDNIRAGMSPEQARREAIIKLGGLEPAKESYRDRRSLPLLNHLAQDTRFALRQMRKNLGFSLVAIVILALGLCASISIFAFVDAALLQPLPYANSVRLAGVFEKTDTCPRCNLSYPDFVDWKRMNTTLSALDVFNQRQFLLRTSTGIETLNGGRVSSGFFRTLGVSPVLGRDFRNGEDSPSAPTTVMLSYETWQNRYGGKNDVIGQVVNLNDEPNTVIGVLPANFHFAPIAHADFWQILQPVGNCEKRRSCHGLYGVGRMKDDASIESAHANMVAIASQLEKEYPDSNRGQGAVLIPLSEVISGSLRPILLALLCGACLLMLIVWANVSSLLLVRSESRKRELAVRRALGASSGRLIMQFVVEGVVLVALGAAVGLAAGLWAIQLLAALIPRFMMDYLPFLRGVGMTGRVLLFGGGMAIIAVVLFAITPAIHLALSKTRDGLAEGSRGSAGMAWSRIGSKLVVAELATAVVLLVCAGLLGKSLYLLLNVQLGFRPENVVAIQLAATDKSYPTDAAQLALERQIQSRVAILPGVVSVGLSSQFAVTHNGNTSWVKFVGKPYNGEHNDVAERAVSAGYFATIGAKLRSGRYFEESEDRTKPRVAIINETFARMYYPRENPVGQQISYLSRTAAPMQIVGVVEDLREGQLDQAFRAVMYLPFHQNPNTFFALSVLVAAGNENAGIAAVRSEIRQLDPDIAFMKPSTMTKMITDSPSAYMHRSSAWLVGAFAAIALLLCIVGLYGVVAYSVSQRTREIGVRIALGAGTGSVYKMVLREAAWLTSAGLLIGLAFAVGLARYLEGLLFGVTSWDVSTLCAVAVVLGSAAMTASFFPARRAASVNPIEALRAE